MTGSYEQLKRSLLRHPLLARAVGLGIITFLVGGAVVIPVYQRASKLRGRVVEKEREAAALGEKIGVLSSLDSEVLGERIKVLDAALPPRKDIVLYLSTIDGLAKQLGLSFAGVSLSPGDVTEATGSAKPKKQLTTRKGIHSLETEIRIDGTREKIYEFLRLLENSFPLMQIKDVKVAAIEGQNDYTLSLRLGMLWAESNLETIKGTVTLFTEEEESYFEELTRFNRFDDVNLLGGEGDSEGSLGKFDLFAPDLVTPQPTAAPLPESSSLPQESQSTPAAQVQG